MQVRDFSKKRLEKASVSRIVIERPAQNARITIHTARPGIVIGKKGEDVEHLRHEVSEMMGVPVHINIEEIRKPDLDAKLVAQNVAEQLERRVMFRRAMKRAVQNAMRQGAEGYQGSGRRSSGWCRNCPYRVVSRRSCATAHPACRYRLRHLRSPDHLRHHRCQSVDLQR